MPSHVPRRSRRPGSRRLHAGHRLASQRAPARLIPGQKVTPGSDATYSVTTRQQRFACARLPGPHLTSFHGRLLRIAHHDTVTGPAACGGLKPPPVRRLRRAITFISCAARHSTRASPTRASGLPPSWRTLFPQFLYRERCIYHVSSFLSRYPRQADEYVRGRIRSRQITDHLMRLRGSSSGSDRGRRVRGGRGGTSESDHPPGKIGPGRPPPAPWDCQPPMALRRYPIADNDAPTQAAMEMRNDPSQRWPSARPTRSRARPLIVLPTMASPSRRPRRPRRRRGALAHASPSSVAAYSRHNGNN